MNELFGVEIFLGQRLKNFPGLSELVGDRIYADLAPQGAAFPLAIVGFQGGDDHGVSGTCDRVYSWLDWSVRAIAPGDGYRTPARAASYIDQALTGAYGPAAFDGRTYLIKATHRLRPLRYVETVGGVRYYHCGGIYRLMVSLAAES